MNHLARLKDLAFKSRELPQDRLALYVELLEALIQSQDALLETFEQELGLLSIELSQEKS